MTKNDSPAYSSAWALGFGLLLALSFCCYLAFQGLGIDYYHFWAVPQFEQAGFDFPDVYNPHSHPKFVEHLKNHSQSLTSPRLNKWIAENENLYETNLHPTGTPFFYSVNRYLIATDNPELGFRLFQILMMLTFVVGSILISRCFGASWVRAVGLTFALLLLHRGLHVDIQTANINRLQFGVFCCAVWFWISKNPLLSVRSVGVGFMFGLLILYKPNTILILLPSVAMFFDRQFFLLGAFLLGLIAGCVVGLFSIMGTDYLAAWEAWRNYMNAAAKHPFALSSGNYALSRLFQNRHVQGSAIGIAALLTAVILGALAQSRQLSNVDSQCLAKRYSTVACLGLVVPLISGPLAWGHYLVLSIPLAVAILVSKETTERLQLVAGAALLLSGVVAFSLIPSVPSWLLLASIQCGLILLFVAGLNLLYQPHPNSSSKNNVIDHLEARMR